MNTEQLKHTALKNFWGYEKFRLGQEEIIDSVLQGRDTLALLPTGGGKSICYQLPALITEGTCIVISPLLALMNDQVQQLEARGIEAAYISAELADSETENILDQCRLGYVKLLYVSPERLSNQLFLRMSQDISFSFIAVDEAHCISEWGQDFRPAYQNIKSFRENFSNVPLMALTATATPKVLQEISVKLGLKNPGIFQHSFARKNISIQNIETSDKLQYIHSFLKYNRDSGIIYTRTRKEAEELQNFLQNNGIKNTDYFHAGLPSHQKNARQKTWTSSDSHVLIATNAFGMGIDKDNVRFILHHSAPASIENYYQEIGRAGRDGNKSKAVVLWNQQELKNFDDILQRQIATKNQFLATVTYLYSIFQIGDGDSSQKTFEVNLGRIHNFTKISVPAIRSVLNFLHTQEIIYYSDKLKPSSVELLINPQQSELLAPKDSYFVELLLRNLAGIQHQKVYFSEKALSQTIGTDSQMLKERLKELQKQEILDYVDGSEYSVRFNLPRNDLKIKNVYWPLYEKIQNNKLQKWEEMKFFLRDRHYCLSKMILFYFGEKSAKNCGICSVCQGKNATFMPRSAATEIKALLAEKPAELEEIAIRLSSFKKQTLLENLIILLDSGEVEMQDFRTYRLPA